MKKIKNLLNILELLYRESKMGGDVGYSKELASKFLVNEKKKNNLNELYNNEQEHEENLIYLVRTFINNDTIHGLDKSLLERDLMTLGLPEEFKFILADMVTDFDSQELEVLRIKNLRRGLISYMEDEAVNKLFRESYFRLTKDRSSITNMGAFLLEVQNKIDGIYTGGKEGDDDDAVLDDIDLGHHKEVADVIDLMKSEEDGKAKLVMGWQAFNDMTQGGLRRGELVTTAALPHNYKTGFALSLFAQALLFNDPNSILTEEEKTDDKKPLAVWVSFEDKVSDKLRFLFEYLYVEEHGLLPDITNFTSKEITTYITDALMKTGFHVKILRVDPTDWSYKNLFILLKKYELQGFALCLLGLDYLSHVPTTGCLSTGPMGTDLRDLFRRVKNKAMRDNFLLITPHQLSTDVLNLLRDGMPGPELLKKIVNKGYYERSRQLSQEIDLEIYLNIFMSGKDTYLHVHRGKHRGAGIIEEGLKSFYLKFPYKSPIPSDLGKKKMSVTTIKNEEDFGFW